MERIRDKEGEGSKTGVSKGGIPCEKEERGRQRGLSKGKGWKGREREERKIMVCFC